MSWTAVSGTAIGKLHILICILCPLTLTLAIHDFAPNGLHQIALNFGDDIKILGVDNENRWYKGRINRTKVVGIFPTSHVIVNEDDAILQELKEVLKEWADLLISHYTVCIYEKYNHNVSLIFVKARRMNDFSRLRALMDSLMSYYKKIINTRNNEV